MKSFVSLKRGGFFFFQIYIDGYTYIISSSRPPYFLLCRTSATGSFVYFFFFLFSSQRIPFSEIISRINHTKLLSGYIFSNDPNHH